MRSFFFINFLLKSFDFIIRQFNPVSFFNSFLTAVSKQKYIFICLFYSSLIFSANKTFIGTGNFSTAARWGGTLPVAGDNLFINGTCTFDNAANNLAYGTLNIGSSVATTLIWPASATNTLNVTAVSSSQNSVIDMTNGGVFQIRSSWNTIRQTFIPGAGTIIWNVTGANSNLPSTITTYYNLITLTGNTSVSFNVNNPGTIINNNLTVSTGTLDSGGKKYVCSNVMYVTSVFLDASNAGTNTVNHITINPGGVIYNTAGETYSISGDLTMLGGAISGAGIPKLNVAGNFLVSSGINNIGNSLLNVIGTTSISATLNVTGLGGSKTLTDLIISSTGLLNCTVAQSWLISGNITVDGTLNTNAGTYSLTGVGKTINGSAAMTFSNIACTGTYTNNANVSLTNSLIGLGGTWSQGSTGILNLGILDINFSIANFNASAVGNTVNYSLAGNQTIRNPTDGSYYNLSSSTSATKSFTTNTIVNGNVSITSSTLDVSTSNFSLSVGGNWTNTAGTFLPHTGTVTFMGTGAQTILKSGGEIFNNITFSNSGNKTLLSAITANTLIINSGLLTANSNSITLTGDWTNNGGLFVPGASTVLFTGIVSQAIFNAGTETFNNIMFSNSGSKTLLGSISANTLTINSASLSANTNSIVLIGDWVNNTSLFNPGTGTVLFNGTTAQTILKLGGEIFNNIIFSNSGNKTLLSSITVNTLTINSGSLTANSNSITLIGDWTNNGGLFIPGVETVYFIGATTQSIFKSGGETFNNITFSNSGNRSLLSAITANTLTINSGSLTTNNFSITLTGNYSNNGGLFIPGTGTVLFTGTTAQSLFKSGGEIFNNITFSNAGNKTLLSPITANTLTINSGSLTANSNSITLIGDWTNNGGLFVPGTETVYFTGTIAQSIFKSGGETFNDITFSNSGTKTLLSAITASNVLINTGSILDVNTTNNQITVKGNFTNSGTFNTQKGLVFLNGVVAQTIGGTSITDFYNLSLNNNAGADITNAENLINALTLSNGTFNTNSLGFTMISTATNTARIAQITGTGDITGNVNVQRFAPGGRTGWALLGTPISSALTFQDWDDDMPISCTSCPDGSAAGFTSIYSYNESVAGSYSISTAYIPITGITNAITPNKGYWVYLGTGSSSTSPITIDVTGTVRKFNNSIPLTKTNTGATFDDGWNLIHNPYPSPIKWSLLRAANPSVDNAIYTYNADLNGGAGGTASYVNGISSPALGSGGIGDTIPMCQGFQVHCTASTNLTALESNKVSGNPTFLRINQTAQDASTQPLLRFYLNGPASFRDETVLYIQEGATNNFDPDFDAIKIPGQNPKAPLIMFKNADEQFQVNGINPITSTFSMPLKTITGYTGTYTISLANFNSFPIGSCISLYDTLTGITTDLKTNKYVFTLSSSTTNARFVVNITINPLNIISAVSQPECLNPNSGAITAMGNNSGPWNYFWKDANGVIIKTSLNKTTADTLLNLTGGNYMLGINTIGQCDNNDSSFTVNSVDIVSAQFSSIDTVYISGGGAINFNNNSTNAVSNTWDFGDSFGFSSNVDPAYNYYSAGIYTVSLIATSNSGCIDTAFKSVVVMPDITTGLISQNNSGSLLLKTLDENEFILQGNILDSSPLNIKLFDALGKLIIDYGNFNSEEINLTVKLKAYNAGIYFLNVEGTNTHKTIKLPLNK